MRGRRDGEGGARDEGGDGACGVGCAGDRW